MAIDPKHVEFDLKSLFDDFFGSQCRQSNPFETDAFSWNSKSTPKTFTPAWDMYCYPDNYVLVGDLPGVAEKDIEITINNNRLLVKGKLNADDTGTKIISERKSGEFSRVFSLPHDADVNQIGCVLKDGILYIRIDKRATPQVRKITINKQ